MIRVYSEETQDYARGEKSSEFEEERREDLHTERGERSAKDLVSL